jgi:hypothetical protein
MANFSKALQKGLLRWHKIICHATSFRIIKFANAACILGAETENGGEVIDSVNSETSAPDVVIVAEEKVPELEVEFSAVETEPILEPEPEPLSVPEEVNSMPETIHVELQPEVESEPEPEPMPVFQGMQQFLPL